MFKKILSVLLCLSVTSFNLVFAAGTQAGYRIEHLPDYKKANTSVVNISEKQAAIMPGNVLKVEFASYFNSKNAKEGDFIDFVLPEGLHTNEGTMILPTNTKITGHVVKADKPKSFNRSATVYINLNQIVLPNGYTYPLAATPYGKQNALKPSKWRSVGKVALYTVGLFGVGSGMGAWIGAASKSAAKGAMAFGMPIGAGVGLLIGIVTPGALYKAKAGKKLYIRLDDCFVVDLFRSKITDENYSQTKNTADIENYEPLVLNDKVKEIIDSNKEQDFCDGTVNCGNNR